MWDLRLGIDTGGTMPTAVADAYQYSTISYPATFAILDHLGLEARDVFVDVGCGKGRVLCCAGLGGVRESCGIEVDESLCAAAEQNARQLRRAHAPITVENLSAQDFNFDKGTVFYLFNPFGADTLRTVLGHLEASWRAQPRPVRIAYVNPKHEAAFHEAGWIERYDQWQPRRRILLDHAVSFWRPLSR